jgi:hypothetical protein
MTGEWLKNCLARQAAAPALAAAIELAIRQPGEPLFNVASPGFRQQQILGKGEVIQWLILICSQDETTPSAIHEVALLDRSINRSADSHVRA